MPTTGALFCLAFVSMLTVAPPLRAQTDQALALLLSALVDNGTLKREQAELIRQVATGEKATGAAAKPASTTTPVSEKKPAETPVFAVPMEKAVSRLVIAGMLHPQWDLLGAEASNGPQPAARNTFLMRRMKLALSGDMGKDWTGLIEGDFAASNTLEQGYVAYRGIEATQIIFGHTKVPFLKEELLSDGVIKGVERSASHRALVEQAGRGFGAKNTGLHLKTRFANGFNFAAAVTNTGAKNSAGTAGNVANQLAYYAQAGHRQKIGDGSIEAAVQVGYLPDLIASGPIAATAAHLYYESPRLTLLAECARARFPRPTGVARQFGFTLEPAFRLTGQWELVLRYSAVDSDGIGISPGSLIRNAPATGDFDELQSISIGGNYYFVGNAVKLTFGYEHAKATGRVTGPATENVINGFRSRFQLLF
jgi:phosphate-selective porin